MRQGDRKEHRPASANESRADQPSSSVLISVSPARVARILALVSVCLTLLSLSGRLLRPAVGEAVKLISVGSDTSIPSWYSALALMFAAVLVAAVALVKRAGGNRRYLYRWALLSLIFAYLSSDEMLSLHEKISNHLLQPALNALLGFVPGGVLNYSWVILYVPLLIIFALTYLRFYWELPARTRLLFLAAGALYVGGGVVTEMFNGWYASAYGGGDLFAGMMTHLEELLEMLGVVVFVYALLSYIRRDLNVGEIRLRLRGSLR